MLKQQTAHLVETRHRSYTGLAALLCLGWKMYLQKHIRQAEQEERRQPKAKIKTEQSRHGSDVDNFVFGIDKPFK